MSTEVCIWMPCKAVKELWETPTRSSESSRPMRLLAPYAHCSTEWGAKVKQKHKRCLDVFPLFWLSDSTCRGQGWGCFGAIYALSSSTFHLTSVVQG